MAIPAATLFALGQASRQFRWLGRSTAATVARDTSSDIQRAVLTAFLLDTKAKAGGPLVRSGPRNRVPILTGRLNESLHITNIGGRRPRLRGVEYGLYIQRYPGGENLWERIWRAYGNSPRFARAVRNAGA